MNRLEHRVVIADVRAWNHTEPADEPCAKVAQHVAIEILEKKHVELRRVLHELHTTRIDDHFFILDVTESFIVVNLPCAPNEHAVGQLHDVGFVHHGDFLPAAVASVLKRPSRDTLRRRLGRHLEAGHDALGNLVFDSAVETFRVLTDDHEVDPLVPCSDARKVPNRTHGRVEVEPLAQLHVDRGETLPDGRRARSFERNPSVSNCIESRLWKHLSMPL